MAYVVNVFTLDGCTYCKLLKEELVKNEIPFEEYEIRKFRKVYDSVLQLTKVDALPTVYLQDPETLSGPIFVAGRDFQTREEAIEKIKKYL